MVVLATTNYRIGRRRWFTVGFFLCGIGSAVSAWWDGLLVLGSYAVPPISYLRPGPYFGLFLTYFALAMLLSLRNIWKARSRCLTDSNRQRMNYLLFGFLAPGIGVFPYLIIFNGLTTESNLALLVLVLSFFVNAAVAVLLVVMSYTVAYFGVLLPDRVVRYRLIRFLHAWSYCGYCCDPCRTNIAHS